MKKINCIAIIALVIFTACKKDRTCSCTTTYTYTQTLTDGGTTYTATGSQTSSDEVSVKKSTKKQALASDCASVSGTINETGSATQTYSNFPSSTYNTTGNINVTRECNLD